MGANQSGMQNEDYGDTLLLWAASHGDRGTVDRLLKAGEDVNQSNDYGDTPLKLAVEHNFTNLAVLVLDYGAKNIYKGFFSSWGLSDEMKTVIKEHKGQNKYPFYNIKKAVKLDPKITASPNILKVTPGFK